MQMLLQQTKYKNLIRTIHAGRGAWRGYPCGALCENCLF